MFALSRRAWLGQVSRHTWPLLCRPSRRSSKAHRTVSETVLDPDGHEPMAAKQNERDPCGRCLANSKWCAIRSKISRDHPHTSSSAHPTGSSGNDARLEVGIDGLVAAARPMWMEHGECCRAISNFVPDVPDCGELRHPHKGRFPLH